MYSLCKNEYKTFRAVETTIRRALGRKKKNRGDESVLVIIHTYKKMS
jgi:hypothetical protein